MYRVGANVEEARAGGIGVGHRLHLRNQRQGLLKGINSRGSCMFFTCRPCVGAWSCSMHGTISAPAGLRHVPCCDFQPLFCDLKYL